VADSQGQGKKDLFIAMERANLQDIPETSMPEGYRIRNYRTGDAAIWTAILKEAEPVYDIGEGTFAEEFPGDEEIRARRILFIEDGAGRAVGTAGAWWESGEAPGRAGKVHWLAVLPSHQNTGAGAALLGFLLRMMTGSWDTAYISSGTSRPHNTRVTLDLGFLPVIRSKYERIAWEEAGRTVTHPAIPKALSRRWWEPKQEPPAPDEVVAWLREAAIPLVSCEAGHGFADMERIRQIVGDARIVSLGEATHGTREFFQLKHRMLEFLVVEMGFTAFGIEASFPEAVMVDRYVTTGEGDPADGLTNMMFWTWNTEEVLEMVRWMRRHNETAHRPVHFYGFDMQSPENAVRSIVRTASEADPACGRELAARLAPLTDTFRASLYGKCGSARQAEVASCLKEVKDRIGAMRFPDERSRGLALLHAQVAIQGEELARSGYGGSIRDRSMAANARALLDLEGPEGKIVLWAHNAHVGRKADWQMGYHLHRLVEPAPVVFGFAFGNGSFQARDMTGNWVLRDFVAPAPPAGSLDGTLGRAGSPLFVLDLRRIPVDGSAAAWWRPQHLTRSAGSGFSDDPEEVAWFADPAAVREEYDALLFVADTTAAWRNPDARTVSVVPTVTAPGPVNLDFAEVGADGLPGGWEGLFNGPSYRKRTGYELEARDGAVSIRRTGVPFEWGDGDLSQTFDAVPFRGRKLRVRAEGRAEPASAFDGAYLLACAYEGAPEVNTQPSDWLTFAVTERPWTAGNWEAREVCIDVPKEADRVEVALILSGNGRAWFRGLSIEPDGEDGG